MPTARAQAGAVLAPARGVGWDDAHGPRPARADALVSYAWEDKAHAEWMRELVDDLRRAEIDAGVAQNELAPAADLAHHIETRQRGSEFVLCVCTPD
jgi:hypothetical protein